MSTKLSCVRHPCVRSQRVSVLAVAIASTLGVHAASAQSITLQKQNSISLGSIFFGSTDTTAASTYGDFPLSVAFDGTTAFVGGVNNAGSPTASIGVVRINNALTGTTTSQGLANSVFTAPVTRGIDGIVADATGVYIAHDDGTLANGFVRKIDANTGSTIWTTSGPTFAPTGFRPTGIAVDPLAKAGTPALGVIGLNSGRRAAIDLDTGSVIYAPSGGTGSAGTGEIFNPVPNAINGTSLTTTYRAVAFDSQGNIALTAAGGTVYGQRDTQGGANFNRIVNPLDTTKNSETRPILVKQTSTGAAINIGQGLGFIEGIGAETLLAVSERVGSPFTTTLSTATDRTGGFTTSAAVDTRHVLLRKTDGSLPTLLATNELTGAEDGLGAAYAGDIKNIAIGRDANNNPVIFVLDFTSKRLDIYGIEPRYTGANNGNWGTASNWTLGALPDSRTTNATFGQAAAATVVNLDSARTVKQLKFDSTNAYTINGTAALTIAAPVNDGDTSLLGAITVLNGSHTVNAPITLGSNTQLVVNNAGDTLTLGSITGTGVGYTKRGLGTAVVGRSRVNVLAAENGTLRLKANGTDAGLSRASTLVLTSGGDTPTFGTLDLTNNGVLIDYDASATNPYADLKAAIASGAITSSVLNSDHVIGIADYSLSAPPTFTDATLVADSTSVMVRYTLKGDANLDGKVAFTDLVALAQNYNKPSDALYQQGDFDGNGAVNFTDLVLLAQHYNQTSTIVGALGSVSDPGFAADWAVAQSLVPEPTTLLALGAALSLVRRRRIAR